MQHRDILLQLLMRKCGSLIQLHVHVAFKMNDIYNIWVSFRENEKWLYI